jgi:hypothetical protein
MTALLDDLAHRPLTAGRTSILWLVLVSALSILACDENTPTETRAASAVATQAGSGDQVDGLAQSDVAALAIALPVNQSVGTAAPNPAFRINQTGTGPNGIFQISNTGNSANALQGQTNGTGIAVRGLATSATGRGGSFQITNATNNSNALTASTNGPGVALSASNTGTGTAGVFFKTGTSSSATLVATTPGGGPAIQGRATGTTGSAAKFDTPGTLNTFPTLDVSTRGGGVAAAFHRDAGSAQGVVLFAVNAIPGAAVGQFELINTVSQAPAIIARTQGGGWAGDFAGTTKGIRITTNAGGAGLQVVNGTKNAVVGTTTGARALYTEESSEVWFTEYGFGRTEHGRARILIDPTFAQTINPDEPYHVFLEEYGDAQLYVAERTPLGFIVQSHGGADIEFSYRIVARRRGYETTRLERAPWADDSPGIEGHN